MKTLYKSSYYYEYKKFIVACGVLRGMLIAAIGAEMHWDPTAYSLLAPSTI